MIIYMFHCSSLICTQCLWLSLIQLYMENSICVTLAEKEFIKTVKQGTRKIENDTVTLILINNYVLEALCKTQECDEMCTCIYTHKNRF